ncbi:MAG: hypothetical protein HQK52_20520 [Oligoflexia bacterium]|nr:hypothetical protein [Oligoflexia bacterium]
MVDVPRSTLQEWARWGEHLDDDPLVISFFDSPQGVAFLHRFTTALHFVFIEHCATGIRNIPIFLELSGLDKYIASSYGTQQQINLSVKKAIIEYAENEREKLAVSMEEKEITTAQDENFAGKAPCLVAIEPVSDFILLEQRAEGRDAETWNTTMTKAMQGRDWCPIQRTD